MKEDYLDKAMDEFFEECHELTNDFDLFFEINKEELNLERK